MLRFQRRSSAALMMVLFAILPGFVSAGDQPDFEVAALSAEFSGEHSIALESGTIEPLSLASADLDEDGVPDLIVGYGDRETGFFVVHSGNLEAVYPRAGQEAGPTFLPETQIFSASRRPDHIAAGDFDADGHFDVVTAATGGTSIELHRGDGDGRLTAAESIELGGRITAFVSGEVNRRDGLADLVLGLDRPSGPSISIFESPLGALRGTPETIDLPDAVLELDTAMADDSGFVDIIATSAEASWSVFGRDRRLTSTKAIRERVAPPTIQRSAAPMKAALETRSADLETLVGSEIVASVAMRLNRDAVQDFVVITRDASRPVVVQSSPRAVFTVDSTADDQDFSTGDGVCDTDDSAGDGPCTLRAAIEQANADAGADVIEFDIAGVGPHAIQPTIPLPNITDTITIDGFTQPGSSANTIDFPGGLDSVLQIELDGSLLPLGSDGLWLESGNNVIRGLVVTGFTTAAVSGGSGITLFESSNNIVEGNFVGCDPTGTSHKANSQGIQTSLNGSYNTIGGLAPGARNLVSGNEKYEVYFLGNESVIQGNLIGSDITGTTFLFTSPSYGVLVSSGMSKTVGGSAPTAGNFFASGYYSGVHVFGSDSLIQGNIIGTDVNGTGWLSNGWGVYVSGGSNITIGGTAPGQGNLISSNNEGGIGLDNASDCRVLGNLIGTAIDGITNRGNAGDGVGIISSSASDHEIGGTVDGAGNIIAYNGWGVGGFTGHTISVQGANNTGNSILGNSVFASQDYWLPIALANDGLTPNDPGDADTGPNLLQNYPMITGISGIGNTVGGSLNSTPSTEFHLEFFSNPSCHMSGHGDGRLFLGSDTVTTDASGDVSFSSTLSIPAPAGSFITSTATDPAGNTSEFSACFQYLPSADLHVTMVDGITEVLPGGQFTYTMTASNAGPDGLAGSTFSTAFANHLNCTTTCVAAGGATCSPGPVVDDIEEEIVLPVGGTATYTAVCEVDHSATGIIESQAAIDEPYPGIDPNPTNNGVTDINTILPVDWGDAPDPTYPTLPASDGARHQIDGVLHLGSAIDADPGGQPSPGADGDDADGADDEDGVTFTTILMTGFDAELEIAASAIGLLNAWLDLDGNGSWLDPGEQIFTDEPVGPGINPLSFPIPASAVPGDSFARFRLDSSGGLSPTGFAADGEVEDEAIEIRFSTIDVAETGQTTSYAGGDDGAYQTGEPWPEPRFTDNGDGTLTDELTGLMWAQDNVNPGPAACGPGTTRSWFLSLDYVDCLNSNSWLGHTDWRMPNVVELASMIHYGVTGDHRPWWNSHGFTMTTNMTWWSSTTDPNGLIGAYCLSAYASVTTYNKPGITGIAVWPVRGGSPFEGTARLSASGQKTCWDGSYAVVPCAGTGQDGDHQAGAAWPEPRFEVDGDCVTDRLTGLMWSRDADIFGLRTWVEAVEDASGLSLCGFDDWRLPSAREAQTLWHFDKKPNASAGGLFEWWSDQGFVNATQSTPWSGTSLASHPTLSAWAMWNTQNKDDATQLGVWPVRGGIQTNTADLVVSISDSADPVDIGDPVTYTVDVANLGPSTASGTTVTTTLPTGSTFVSGSGSGWTCGELDLVVTCDMPTLGVAAAPPITIEITTPPGFGTITAVVVADSLNDDPIGNNNGDSESTTVIAYDFGDAPDPSYPTLTASNGAAHLLGSGLILGAAVDDDPDGQPTAGADGDDNDGYDDDDGVVLPASLLAGAEESVDVTASAAGRLNAWVDFNADGDWDDPGERVFTDEALTSGVNNLSLTVPLHATVGTTYARFRIDSTGGLTPTGLAADGEVEDYATEILPSADLQVSIGDSPDPIPEGGLLTYFVSLGNNGQLDATDVELQYTLPPEANFVSVDHPGCSETGGVVTCALGTITSGAAVGITIEVDIPYGTTGDITATAAIQTTDSDPIVGNDTDTEVTTVVDEASYIFSDGFKTGDTSRWHDTSP